MENFVAVIVNFIDTWLSNFLIIGIKVLGLVSIWYLLNFVVGAL